MIEMMDLSEKGSGLGSEEKKKACADCQTTKTPLWRGGPAGPKSLCNACGIRNRKKRRALLGLKESSSEDMKKKKTKDKRSVLHRHKNTNLNVPLKLRLLTFRREVLLERSKVQKHLGEEEQAAILLMALSSASFC